MRGRKVLESTLQGEQALSEDPDLPGDWVLRWKQIVCACVYLKFKDNRVIFIFQNERKVRKKEFSKAQCCHFSFVSGVIPLWQTATAREDGQRGGGGSSTSRISFL